MNWNTDSGQILLSVYDHYLEEGFNQFYVENIIREFQFDIAKLQRALRSLISLGYVNKINYLTGNLDIFAFTITQEGLKVCAQARNDLNENSIRSVKDALKNNRMNLDIIDRKLAAFGFVHSPAYLEIEKQHILENINYLEKRLNELEK
ncbi:MAG: hypothetical protein HXX08_22450 [Chloroflexi bacterium]|uniref:Uncharacterized protein n=1 Tax=Candidatus Chlorohelix allophototropha TaxID=3003348 RepID=A0A8T7M929_9CHLR|nr:hypothetical protein [Chloroflexota bacterium]WJW68560.1 hypothetical protein OZ401_004174 [Chloroflexota bacterium L227-S17]